MRTAPFAVFLTVLLVRNAFLFSTPEHEDADMGAYSIQIEQARRFSLLVGNYSREGFNHPGPAFLYVQSWGEDVFWAALRVVPTAWNGQLIALYALNALFAALVAGTFYGWTRSPAGALTGVAATALLGALHPAAFSSDWMPYVYVPAFLAFLTAIASVAAGRVSDLWAAALSGWFLIHGHVCFLLFVPALTACAAVALLWPRRRRLRAALRSFFLSQRRAWVPALVISALFALPIALELIEHWPGNFAKYITYGSSARAGGHGAAQVAHYTLWFWSPHAGAWAVPLVLGASAVAVTWRCPAGPVRRFCAFLLAFDALATAAFLTYAAVGIDQLNDYYIGYFYWSVPVTVAAVIVAGLLESLPRRYALAAAAAAALAACAAFAVAPQTRTSTAHADPANPAATGPVTDPALPAAVARLAALSGHRPVVFHVGQNAWPELTGLLVQSERAGVTSCVTDPRGAVEVMVTSQFICTRAELAAGAPYWLYVPGTVPPGTPVVFRLRRATVTARPS